MTQTRQHTVQLRLTTGELDVLSAIACDAGRRESAQAALIYRLRREYRKACRAAGIEPNPTLLYQDADDSVMITEQARLCDTLGDILAAVRDATERRCDHYEIDDPEPDEYEDEDDKGGEIVCAAS